MTTPTATEQIFCLACSRNLTSLVHLYHAQSNSRFCDEACLTAWQPSEVWRTPPISDQPPPQPGKEVVWRHVMRDLEERVELGKQRYGTELMTRNGRDPLVDAYQEALDLVLYLRQAILEKNEK